MPASAISLAALHLFPLSPLPASEAPAACVQLGSRSFLVREAASAALERMGQAALPALRTAKLSDDAEIRSRATRLLDRYFAVMPANYGRMPWIDMLPDTTKPLQRHYLDLAGPDAFCDSDWPAYRHATYLWCRDLLQRGVPRAFVIAILNGMALREIDHRRAHGMVP